MIKITGNTLLKTYLYLISFITLTVAVFMGAVVAKAGISYALPLSFSYTLYEPTVYDDADLIDADKDLYIDGCYNSEVINIDGTEYCWDENTRKEDLINGISVFLSMVILFGLHQFAIKKTKKRGTPELLIKIYTFVSLFTYSIIGIVSIPMAIYETAQYFLNASDYNYAPAYAIAVVILVLPLWYIFFDKTLKLKDD